MFAAQRAAPTPAAAGAAAGARFDNRPPHRERVSKGRGRARPFPLDASLHSAAAGKSNPAGRQKKTKEKTAAPPARRTDHHTTLQKTRKKPSRQRREGLFSLLLVGRDRRKHRQQQVICPVVGVQPIAVLPLQPLLVAARLQCVARLHIRLLHLPHPRTHVL